MKFFRLSLIWMVSVFSMGPIRAEVLEVTGTEDLAPDRVVLDFAGRPACSPGDQFGNWGVGISSSGGFSPVVNQVFFPLAGFVSFLQNEACEETPAGGDPSGLLIFDFEYPVTEAAFTLGNGGAGVTAEIKAFDSAGNLLGTLQSPEVDAAQGVFFGVQVASGPAISKVTISYSSAELAERVQNFSFAYQDRPDFASVLPQVGDGALGSGALRTIIVVSNLTDSTAHGQVALFAPDGSALGLELAGQTGTSPFGDGEMSNDFSILPGGSAVLTTPGTSDPVVQGYAVVTASVPVQSTAVFQILDEQGAPTQEAGVSGTRSATFLSAPVTRAMLGGVDTGIAVVNTGDSLASVEMHLVDKASESSGLFQTEMEPGTHMAAFVPDLFPGAPANFVGSILIESDLPVAVTVIRTLGGLVSASLEVAQ